MVYIALKPMSAVAVLTDATAHLLVDVSYVGNVVSQLPRVTATQVGKSITGSSLDVGLP